MTLVAHTYFSTRAMMNIINAGKGIPQHRRNKYILSSTCYQYTAALEETERVRRTHRPWWGRNTDIMHTAHQGDHTPLCMDVNIVVVSCSPQTLSVHYIPGQTRIINNQLIYMSVPKGKGARRLQAKRRKHYSLRMKTSTGVIISTGGNTQQNKRGQKLRSVETSTLARNSHPQQTRKKK